MSLQNHVQNLKKRSQMINDQIHSELSRPLPNSLNLFELKSKRLRLKEEIATLI